MPKLSTLAPGDWVTMNARQQPDRPCFRTAERVHSYEEVNARVNRLARGLRELGLRKGDRITVLSTDSVPYLELILASMKVGTAIMPMNFRLSEPEIEKVLSAAAPALHVIEARYAGSAAAARAASSNMKAVASFGEAPDCDLTLDAILALSSDESNLDSDTSEEDVLTLMLTSGTTGTPKIVMQSQRMIRAVTFSGVYEQRLRREYLMYSGAPMFHVAGVNHILYGVSRGACSLVLPQWEAATALHWLQEGAVNHCMMVPSMILAVLELPEVTRSQYPDLRSIMFGGAPMPPSVIRRMADVFNCDFYNAFGSTQVGGQTVFNADDHKRALAGEEHLLGSIGRPVYGTDLRIVDADGNDVAQGELGEIWTRSESVFSGYLNQPELTAETVVDGWYRTGDVGHRDPDGYIFLGGRSDDMIIRGGENVYPVEIESVLAGVPGLVEVVVVGVPDQYWGQTVAAVATVRPGAEVTLETVQNHCRGRLASYKIPERLVLLPDLPRNSTGKVQKHLIRDQLAAAGAEDKGGAKQELR